LKLAEPEAAKVKAPLLMLRPERLTLAPAGEPAPCNDCNVFPGKVVERIFQGDSVLLAVRLAGGELTHLRVQNRSGNAAFSPEEGTHVKVLLHRADAHIVSAEA
jgi:ABC-type Fe3+/spermidine/putrescine transport system ATPase subunit